MFKKEKINFASKVVKKVSTFNGFILCRHTCISAVDLAEIRANLRTVGGQVQMGSNRVLHKGFEVAKSKGELQYDFAKLLQGMTGASALIFFNEDMLRVLASVREAVKKYARNIEIVGVQCEDKALDINRIDNISSYKSTGDVFQGIYTFLTVPMSGLVMFAKAYYNKMIEEGTNMITKNEIGKTEDLISSLIGDDVSKEVKELLSKTFQLQQLELLSYVEGIQKVCQHFNVSVGFAAPAQASGTAADSEEEVVKKDYKLKVTNVDSANKLRAVAALQSMYKEHGTGNSNIDKMIDAAKLISLDTVFDLKPLTSEVADSLISTLQEFGVVVTKI